MAILTLLLSLLGSPLSVAEERRKEFARIDAQKTSLKHKLFVDIVSSVCSDNTTIQQAIQGQVDELHGIIELAFNWNSLVKGQPVQHLYRPFSPPLLQFDSHTSKSYYAYGEDQPGIRVTAVATMGLELSDLRPTGPVKYVVALRASVIVAKVCF